MSDLKRQLDRAYEKKVVDTVDTRFRKVVLSVFGSVIRATPVDTGRARGNWQTTLDAPAREQVEGTTPRVGEADAVAAAAKMGKVAFVSNNVPYIGRLNEGSSKQAPAGFVEKAAQAGAAVR
ncbi:MAG: hypothetical protein AAF141_11330 [Pseudomonadota bacterium]